jgi:hypothetical protein
MKFKISRDDLCRALSVVKKSHAFSKMEGEETVPLLIRATDKEISFIVTNLGFWSRSKIDKDFFPDEEKIKDVFHLETPGEFFVDGVNFIGHMEKYPKGSTVRFSVEDRKNGKSLMVSCRDFGKKGRVKSTGFVQVKPRYFDEDPPQEKRETIEVDPIKLIEAVEAVEFVAESDETKRCLWGIQLQIFSKEDIASCAANKLKICWFDKKGYDRNKQKPKITAYPLKNGLVPITKTLEKGEVCVFEIGEKNTIIKQKYQWHAVPNSIQTPKESMPNWRFHAEDKNKKVKTIVKVPRSYLIDCIKSSNLATGGEFGLRMSFDTDENKIDFSLNAVSDATMVKSFHNETEPIDKDNIEGEPFNDSLVLTLDDFGEMLNRCAGEMITFKIINSHEPVQIIDEEKNVNLISSVVVGVQFQCQP